jgi:hypothetical protein
VCVQQEAVAVSLGCQKEHLGREQKRLLGRGKGAQMEQGREHKCSKEAVGSSSKSGREQKEIGPWALSDVLRWPQI